ncbi:MAG: LamG domain-containing protein [Candidatus Marsarchaeota archaeon]|nr:LamG domain-containing protein [Candidatus Marsarchaeota archaeon]
MTIKKAQSAMEYLMTYGWAILIIAVVLGALFQLGVFNSGTFSPKAPPGACQVLRPNGPGSVSFINLEGVCNGELPQYVAIGASGGKVAIASPTGFLANGAFSVTAWVNPNSYGSSGGAEMVFGFGSSSSFACGAGGNGADFFIRGPTSDDFESDCIGGTGFVPALNTWSFVAFTYSSSTNVVNITMNTQTDHITSATLNYAVPPQVFNIGARSDGGFLWPGELANVQVYNTSLSANEVQSLYTEGIGGAPLRLQNLVGWWPLNGNANDYSGNNNNGVPSGVTYTNQWTSGYTTP